ncbi:hypothetical protein J2S74_002739 [Evansella vedderi]|uniref:Uncharacterized protein n=1 Tax=Evansella vedderi TaxID=38282 RepID=A0ABT9ZX98_9BACI|nr:hypothetical protein [Evansella vedderi]MDQ0255357.1 hypothetical protein [Evansella vedderi]
MITIYPAEIIKTDTGVRLQAPFKMNNMENVLWYEVEEKYGDFLTTERADAFVVGLLWLAIKKVQNIEVVAPISERLYFTLNNYLIPVLSKQYGKKTIKIRCSELAGQPVGNTGAVGTGLSCGIDSFSTICDHLHSEFQNYNITHFTFFNVGSHGGKRAQKLFTRRANNSRACANELGKELITIDSNISKVLRMRFESTHTLRSMSAVLTLQKLFNVYYYASYAPLDYFHMDKRNPAYFDPFTLNMLSTESLHLFSSGVNRTRFEKTRMVAHYEPSYKYLNVCVKSAKNCSKCWKCLRTLLSLEIIGKLDNYGSIFNLNRYYKERARYISKVLEKSSSDIFLKEIHDEMVRTNFKK